MSQSCALPPKRQPDNMVGLIAAPMLIFGLLGVMLLFLASAAFADHDLWWIGEGKALRGSVLAMGRIEAWDWFSSGPKYDHKYTQGFGTIRPGLGFRWTRWGAWVEGQATAIQGLPPKSSPPAPKGAMGTGALYYGHIQRRDDIRVYVKHAYAENTDVLGPWINTLRIRGGRFPYSDGAEIMAGEPKLDWLKRVRISERLIGPFAWTAFHRSYDGVDLGFQQSWGGLTAMAAHPTQGGFEERGGVPINTIDLATSSLTLTPGLGLLPHTAARAFYVGYWDRRLVTQRVDNVIATAKRVNLEIHTFGGEVLGAYPVGPGELDVLGWGLMQKGNWYELDHDAFSAVGELGYQFTQVWSKPHLRAGGAYGSGDSHTKDKVHETFFQVLPTARKYAFTPFYNMMNMEDLYLQLFFKPSFPWTFRMEWHQLELAHPNDRWYVGGGATQNRGSIFGYAGRPSQGKDAVGRLVDLSITWVTGPATSINLYAAHVFGGGIPRTIYGDKNMNFGYIESEYRW